MCGDEKKGKRQDERQEQGTTRNTTRHGPREEPSTFGASFVRARCTIGACTVVAVSQPFASRCKTKTCLCHPVSSCVILCQPVAFSFVHFFNNSLTIFSTTLLQLLLHLLLLLLLQLLSTNLSPSSVSKPLHSETHVKASHCRVAPVQPQHAPLLAHLGVEPRPGWCDHLDHIESTVVAIAAFAVRHD